MRALTPAQDVVALVPRRDFRMPLPDLRHDGALEDHETVLDAAVEQPDLPYPRSVEQGRLPGPFAAEPNDSLFAAEQVPPPAQPEAEVQSAAFGAEDVVGARRGSSHEEPASVPCVGAAWSARVGAPFSYSHLGHAAGMSGPAVLAAVVQEVSAAHFGWRADSIRKTLDQVI